MPIIHKELIFPIIFSVSAAPKVEIGSIVTFTKGAIFIFFKLSIHGLFFFIFVVSIPTVDSKQKDVRFKSSPMTGFEPWTSGIGNDHSTN